MSTLCITFSYWFRAGEGKILLTSWLIDKNSSRLSYYKQIHAINIIDSKTIIKLTATKGCVRCFQSNLFNCHLNSHGNLATSIERLAVSYIYNSRYHLTFTLNHLHRQTDRWELMAAVNYAIKPLFNCYDVVAFDEYCGCTNDDVICWVLAMTSFENHLFEAFILVPETENYKNIITQRCNHFRKLHMLLTDETNVLNCPQNWNNSRFSLSFISRNRGVQTLCNEE